MKFKKILSVLLTLIMLIGMMPCQISAATDLTFNGTQANISKITSGTLILSQLSLYKGTDKSATLPIVRATQDGSTFNIVLESDTELPITIGYSFDAGSASPADYTLESRTESQTVTVTGVGMGPNPSFWPRIAVTFNFSLAEGASYSVTMPENPVGYAVDGEEKVYEGDNYSFRVNVSEGYDGSNMVVKVNGEVVDAVNGVFTVENVSEALTISVSGVTVKEQYEVVLNSGNGYTLSSTDTPYKNEDYIFRVTIDEDNYKIDDNGIKVLINGEENKAVDNGDGTYTIPALEENKSVTVFGVAERELFKVIKPNVPGVTFNGDNDVREGKDYTFTLTIDASYNATDMSVTDENGGTVAFSNGMYKIANVNVAPKIVITGVVPKQLIDVVLPSVTGLVISGESGVFQGESYTFTVSVKNGYTAENIVVTVNETPLNGNNGTYIIENVTRTPQINITATINKLPGDVTINKVSGNGSLNYIAFLDAEGNAIAGIDSNLNGTEISVILPKGYNLNGIVKAVFDLTDENDDGYPFISTSSATTGNGAYGSKFTEKLINLTNGAATFDFYYYNNKTSAVDNGGQTLYKIKLKVKNDLPVLANGMDATTSATITAGESYTLDLSPLFTDVDKDELTYKVSINGESAVSADTNYSFTTDVAGTYKLVFTANDSKDDSDDTYTVTLTVENSTETDSMTVYVPEGLNPSFYVSSGFSDGVDIQGDVLTTVEGETAEGMTAYTLNYPINVEMISVRTNDFGGMAFAAQKDGTVTLRKVKLQVVDYDKKPATSTNVVTYGKNTAVAGADGWLVVAGGEYVLTATPSNADLVKVSETVTIELGNDTYVAEVMLGISNPMSITVPTGAKAELYKYNQYYSNTKLDAKIVRDNGDGTTSYQFIADTKSNGASYIYRVSMEGKITKAGWLAWNQQNLTITYTENDKAPSYRLDDYSMTGEANSSIAEDSLLLNGNSRNHLNLSVGESKTLKAYRAWEIIPVSYNNYIITPDFNYAVIVGNDVVSLAEKESPSAGDGDWMTLTALKEGIAIIEVTYDAIAVSGGGFDGVYGASDPNRSGLLVVQVGENNDASVKFGIESFSSYGTSGTKNISYNSSRQKEWDCEFDTLYFTGNSSKLTLKPTASSEITEVSVSHDKGETWINLAGENGVYDAEIVQGNNIIKVKTASGTAYQVVRGDKVSVKFTEVSDKSDGDGIVEAGETIRVALVGLHSPIPKMAGNYNPGYGGNNDGYSSQHLNYTCNGTEIYGPGLQYNFITSANYVEIVMPEDGSDVTLKNGYIGTGVIGLANFSSGGDSHRNIPDAGCATRGSATTYHTQSILPVVLVKAGDGVAPNNPPIVRKDAVCEKEIYSDQNFAINPDTLFADPDDDALFFSVSVNGTEAVEAPLDYKFTPGGTGTYTLLFTATDGKETVQHTITLTVTKRPSQGSSQEKPETENDFGLNTSEIAGYVTISFVDNGVRVKGESGLKYPKALGTIIKATKVPYKSGEKITHVTKRLLDSLGIRMSYTGTLESGFYLGAICDFESKGTPYDSFGEFDAGVGSGWMITLNKTFIEYGASEFEVKNGDVIKWQYTCQLGKDIGDPFYSGLSSSDEKNKTENETEESTEENGEEQKEETANNAFTEVTFADVGKDDWYYESVRFVYENNLMKGTSNGFEPESKMTRAMLVTVLYRMANPESVENTHGFTDVSEGKWYTDAVAWAASNGIVNGISATEFAPDSDITREQMALIIYRFAKMQGIDTTDASTLENFTDIKDVSDWAIDAIRWANKTELVTGTSQTTLSPKATATRAQVAKVLMCFCEHTTK